LTYRSSVTDELVQEFEDVELDESVAVEEAVV
jgi:hypothetical protein